MEGQSGGRALGEVLGWMCLLIIMEIHNPFQLAGVGLGPFMATLVYVVAAQQLLHIPTAGGHRKLLACDQVCYSGYNITEVVLGRQSAQK